MSTEILLSVPVTSLIERDVPIIPDLGLGYVASALRERDISVDIVDWNPPLDEDGYRQKLVQISPRLVGTKVFTVNFRAAYHTVNLIRRTLPDAIVVVGGPHPSMTEPEFLFDEFPGIDFAFRGETETSFPAFVELLRRIDYDRRRIGEIQDELPCIGGLVWQQDGGIQHNAAVLEDIDEVPLPAWDLINPNRSLHRAVGQLEGGENPHVAPLLSTRGCPFACTFCGAHHVNGKKVRRRHLDGLLEEIRMVKEEYGIRQFVITDSSFILDLDYVRAFCEALLERGLDIRWECNLEAQMESDPREVDELMGLMKRSGCRKVVFSPETTSARIIRVVKKNYDPEKMRPLIRLAKKHEFNVLGFFILGFPEETLADVDDSLRFALSEPFDQVFFSLCIPLPGTEIYDDLRTRYGFEKIDWLTANYSNYRKQEYQIGQVEPRVLYEKICLAYLRHQLKTGRGVRKVASRTTATWVGKYLYTRFYTKRFAS